jgi:alpha-tubulin suppressor-like RCC1 family protein
VRATAIFASAFGLFALLYAGCNLVVGLDRYTSCTDCIEGGTDAIKPPPEMACAATSDCQSSLDGRVICNNGYCARPVSLARGQSLHACVLLSDSSVWCWGRNNGGQLGRQTTGDHAPGRVTILDDKLLADKDVIEEVSLGLDATCVRTQGGKIWCWGA